MINGIYLGMVATIFGTYVGYKYALRYKKRRQFFNEWYTFNIDMKCELSYSKNTILQVLEKKQGVFYERLSEYIYENKRVKIKELTKVDEDFFYDFCKNIGKSDSKSQQEYIVSINEKVKQCLSECEKLEKLYSPLCIKLGFISGLAVLVLVI